jgi:hypothetical protein
VSSKAGASRRARRRVRADAWHMAHGLANDAIRSSSLGLGLEHAVDCLLEGVGLALQHFICTSSHQSATGRDREGGLAGEGAPRKLDSY